MTLEEAIIHCKEKACDNTQCAIEHRQLAEWLEELKQYHKKRKKGGMVMTQEEKQLLLKDLCARLPYNVVVHCTDNDTDYECFLTTDILNELLHNIEYYDYKPYLRPMSSMTEEEEVEFEETLQYTQYTLESYDWLNGHHFDYRGLIEKGLALEAPEGMYKTE